MRIKN